jgi:predicted MFS family arabinose efflux permease
MDDTPPFPIYRAAVSGLLAMLVSIGVARFGFSPLVPALVAAHWFSAPVAFWMGSANLAGYFVGAAVMRGWRGRIAARPVFLLLMAVASVAVFCSAWHFSAFYYGALRLITGVTGGALMVLMAAAVVGRAPAAVKGRVSGVAFAGMGCGITLSAVLTPFVLRYGLVFTWLSLGALCVAATAVVFFLMPAVEIAAVPKRAGREPMGRNVLLLTCGYAGAAFGVVPHILFWASFVAIGLHRGVAAGAEVSALFGLGAMVGPPVLGRLADRFGFLTVLIWGFLVMAGAVGFPLLDDSLWALAVCAVGGNGAGEPPGLGLGHGDDELRGGAGAECGVLFGVISCHGEFFAALWDRGGVTAGVHGVVLGGGTIFFSVALKL